MAVIKRARLALFSLLPVLLAVLIFAGMFARITLLARLSEKSKQISALEAQAERALVRTGQMELTLNELRDLEAVAIRAAELGMQSPTAGQIRVLQSDPTGDTPAKGGHEPADAVWREEWD